MKNKFNVIVTKREQLNPFYDERTKWNGGGYDQPSIEFIVEGIGKGFIVDMSCGEFGSEISAGFTTLPDETGMKYEYQAYWGTKCDYPESNFPCIGRFNDAIYEATGYYIPTSEDIESIQDE